MSDNTQTTSREGQPASEQKQEADHLVDGLKKEFPDRPPEQVRGAINEAKKEIGNQREPVLRRTRELLKLIKENEHPN